MVECLGKPLPWAIRVWGKRRRFAPYRWITSWSGAGAADPRGVWRIVEKYARKAGLERMRSHVPHHTFAIRLLRHGMDIVTVAKLLGKNH